MSINGINRRMNKKQMKAFAISVPANDITNGKTLGTINGIVRDTEVFVYIICLYYKTIGYRPTDHHLKISISLCSFLIYNINIYCSNICFESLLLLYDMT